MWLHAFVGAGSGDKELVKVGTAVHRGKKWSCVHTLVRVSGSCPTFQGDSALLVLLWDPTAYGGQLAKGVQLNLVLMVAWCAANVKLC